MEYVEGGSIWILVCVWFIDVYYFLILSKVLGIIIERIVYLFCYL